MVFEGWVVVRGMGGCLGDEWLLKRVWLVGGRLVIRKIGGCLKDEWLFGRWVVVWAMSG